MENDNVEKTPVLENEADLIDALAKQKESSVSKDKYQKLYEENQRMIKAFSEGKELEQQESTPAREEKELLEVLSNNNTNNLDYAIASLELHRLRLKKDGVNDYLPNGANYSPTDADIKSAERFESVLEQCIKEANGNSAVFTALMDSRTDDIKLPGKK